MEDPSWMEFQKRLTSLMDSFHLLLPEDKPQAIASVRESVGQMQSAVKQQLCSDAMRTVAAMAESLIQVCNVSDLLYVFPFKFCISSSGILGNVRYSTVQ